MTERRPALSPRQMEVLNLMNLAKTRGEIAQELRISAETVRDHIDGIKAELHVPSGQDFVYTVRSAYERGVLEGPSPLLRAAAARQSQPRGKKNK